MSLIGGHVSVAGGIEKSVSRAVDETFEAMQIFVSPPRSFKPNSYSPEQIYSFNRFYKEAGMKFLVQHAIYLLNLGAERKSTLGDMSIESLVGYMKLGHAIGSSGSVVHVGSRFGGEGTKRAALAIQEILDETPEGQNFIIENAASRFRIGYDIEDFVRLYDGVKTKERLKVCIDTQHVFAAGLDLSDPELVDDWIQEFDSKVGCDQIMCLHVNDSKTNCGSGIDRHENVLEGSIGMKGLREFLAHQKLLRKPLILETPGWDPKHKGPDRENKEKLEKIIC